MTGLDTSVLVRFITQDDPEQGRRARDLINSFTSDHPGFLSVVAIAELGWVLRSRYRVDKVELASHLERLLNSEQLVVENLEVVVQALARFKDARAGFADCLIERSGHLAGCQRTVTFD